MDINKTFIEGIHLFNQREINKAHICWEKIWKKGNEKHRIEIKGFIQLTGSILNEAVGKDTSALYLSKKSVKNIQFSKDFTQLIDTKTLLNTLNERTNSLQNNKYYSKEIKITLL